MGSEPIKKHGKSIPFENDMFLYISETGKYDSVLPSRSRLPSSVKYNATPPQPLHFYKGNGYSKNAKTTNGTKKCSYFTVSYDARRHDSQKEREPRNSKFNCGICTFWKEPGSPKALFWDRGHTHRHTDRDESAAGRAQGATRACARADFKKYPVHGALLASPPSLQLYWQCC